MKMNDFICSCFFMDGDVIDELCEDFDIDFDEDDVMDCLKDKSEEELRGVGQELLYKVLEKIMDKYPELDKEKFDSDFSSPSYPDFYYDGQKFDNKEGLDAIVEELGV